MVKILGVPLLIILVFSLPTLSWGAEETLSLGGAIARSLQNSHRVKSARYDRESAAYRADAATSRYLPRVGLEEGFGASNSPTRVFMMKLNQGRFTQDDFAIASLNNPAASTDFTSLFYLEQPLFDPGVKYARTVSVQERERRDLLLDQEREDVAFAVFRAYIQVRTAMATVAAAEQEIADTTENLRVARTRGKEGTGLRSDELRAETALAEAEQRRISAGNSLELARLRLAVEMGEEPGTTFATEPLAPGRIFLHDPEDSAGTAGAGGRFDLEAMRKLAEKGDTGVDAAKGSYLPTLYATAGYQMNSRDLPFGRDNDAWSAGVTLRWELFDGLRRHREIQSARAERNAAYEMLEQSRKAAELQLREAVLGRAESGKRLEVARASVSAAEEGTRLIRMRFENGLATMAELLDAESAQARARLKVAETEGEYLTAIGKVYLCKGSFLKEIAP